MARQHHGGSGRVPAQRVPGAPPDREAVPTPVPAHGEAGAVL
ncbi:hypothetical protein [Streptomyces sp. NPDC002644]